MLARFAYGYLLLIACLLCLLPTVSRAERRIALVIGNAGYEGDNVLLTPINDATDMAAALRQLGFEVTLLPNANLRAMREAIETLSRQLRLGGVGLFYFAGHGVQVGGENYLIPIGASLNREQDIPYEAVPVGRILGGMEDADNGANIVILDACRNNPLASWRSKQQGFATLHAPRGSLIAFATDPGGVADDGSGRNGLYTASLLTHMRTPGLSVEQLFKKVRAEVVAMTRGKQSPWESSSLIRDFSFAPQSTSPPSVVSPPFSPPTGLDVEAAMWGAVEKSHNPEDLIAFLNAYPHGRFAPAARMKLQQLQGLASQRVEEQKQLEAQRRAEEEQKRLEAQRRAEEEQKQQQDQVARLEPYRPYSNKIQARTAVSVPAATLKGFGSTSRSPAPDNWTKKVPAFRMDLQPVSNREFLDFVISNPQWKKSQVSSSVHDGDYLKHWPEDTTVQPEDMDRPVRYVSFFAAEAYCKAREKKVPGIETIASLPGFGMALAGPLS